ncbi:MAG: CHAT domain-containing protein, partial [Planctomycetota bacterium]|nr:CHAT domain-containing protein [Planctomycetota bacterium]
ALLMERFYANLAENAGKRDNPLPKVAALAEAKEWLRHLKSDEIKRLKSDVDTAVARGTKRLNTRQSVVNPEEQYPFSHPYYWAGFILVGLPD